MFGIGLSEVILIFLVIVVFIRPDDLPKFLRTAGRYYGKAKKLYKELIQVKDKIVKEMNEVASLEELPKSPDKIPDKTTTAKETPQALPEKTAPALPEKEPEALQTTTSEKET